MDPEVTLRDMILIAEQDAPSEDSYETLAELVRSLDAWLCRGGFLPKRWADPQIKAAMSDVRRSLEIIPGEEHERT